MDTVTTLRPQGNHSPIYRYFNDPLDRTEAQRAERATWHDYCAHALRFEADPSLDNEISAVAARDAWHAAWRAANPS